MKPDYNFPSWLFPIMKKGKNSDLTKDDLPAAPHYDDSKELGNILEK